MAATPCRELWLSIVINNQAHSFAIHSPRGVSCSEVTPRRTSVAIYARFKTTVAVHNAWTRQGCWRADVDSPISDGSADRNKSTAACNRGGEGAHEGGGAILPINFPFIVLKSTRSSSVSLSHDTNASPSSNVGTLRALVSSFHPFALEQMLKRTNHSAMLPDEKVIG